MNKSTFFHRFFQSDLDAKTEELFQLEPKMDTMKARVIELEAELSTVHRQIK